MVSIVFRGSRSRLKRMRRLCLCLSYVVGVEVHESAALWSIDVASCRSSVSAVLTEMYMQDGIAVKIWVSNTSLAVECVSRFGKSKRGGLVTSHKDFNEKSWCI